MTIKVGMESAMGYQMKAINLTNKTPGGERVKLAELLPLKTPLVVEIFPIYACNFACRYCVFSVDKKDRSFISDRVFMKFNMYKKYINDMTSFPTKVKVLRFAGMGEPLLNRRIVDMMLYATVSHVADKIEIITNASLLTPKMSDALISAGLSRMVVSIQGTSRERYKEICGVDIDFDNLINSLGYFFNNKKHTEVYIKILDYALEDKRDEHEFYKIFGDICDSIGIERAVPIYPNVDYSILGDVSTTQFGSVASDVQICPRPFATMYIIADGKVTPCYSMTYPEIMGDCNNESLYEIWNNKRIQKFRLNMLDGIKNKVCADCNMIKHRFCIEDDLSNDVERLREFYK